MATDPIPAVELRGLVKQFGSHEVLAGIDLAVMPGETVCIVGPSGSGKSTLLRCINWLERPDRGSVFLHGTRVGYRRAEAGNVLMSDRELAMLRTRVGMVFQHFNLWPHMTALGNVIESPIHVLGRPRPEVLLFDEATSALDPELVGEVLAVMRDLARDGLTMIVVTHEMKFAREAASRVVFLDKGRIVEVATAKAFFESPATDRARQFMERYR